jgi:hypothetical protein
MSKDMKQMEARINQLESRGEKQTAEHKRDNQQLIGRIEELEDMLRIRAKEEATSDEKEEHERHEECEEADSKEEHEEYEDIDCLEPHPAYFPNRHFKYESNQGQFVERTSNDSHWQNFIIHKQLNPGNKYCLRLRLLKSASNSINIGVTSQATFNKFFTLKSEHTASLSLQHPSIWNGASLTPNEPKMVFLENDMIRMHVDLVDN